MAWRQAGDKPLSEPMMVWFTDAYMCHLASMSLLVSYKLHNIKLISLKEKNWIGIQILLKIVPKGPVDKKVSIGSGLG